MIGKAEPNSGTDHAQTDSWMKRDPEKLESFLGKVTLERKIRSVIAVQFCSDLKGFPSRAIDTVRLFIFRL
jgi:hypothetical protein